MLLVRFASECFYSTDIVRAEMAEWSKALLQDSIVSEVTSSNQARGSNFFMCVACFLPLIFVVIYFHQPWIRHFFDILSFQKIPPKNSHENFPDFHISNDEYKGKIWLTLVGFELRKKFEPRAWFELVTSDTMLSCTNALDHSAIRLSMTVL